MTRRIAEEAEIESEEGGLLGLRPIRLFRFSGIWLILQPTLIVIGALLTFLMAKRLEARTDWPAVKAWVMAGGLAALHLINLTTALMLNALITKRMGLIPESVRMHLFGGSADLRHEPDRPLLDFLLGFTGPTIFLAFSASALLISTQMNAAARSFGVGHPLIEFAVLGSAFLYQINMILFIFNLLPIFPLDGARILRSCLWGLTGKYRIATKLATRGGMVLCFILIGWGAYLYSKGRIGANFWWMAIMAAFMMRQSETYLKVLPWIQRGFELTVREALNLMRAEKPESVTRVRLETETVEGLRAEFDPEDAPAFEFLPVGRNGEIIGVVQLAAVYQENVDPQATLAQIARPVHTLPKIEPHACVNRALRIMDLNDTDVLRVCDKDRLIGVVSHRDLMIQLHARGFYLVPINSAA